MLNKAIFHSLNKRTGGGSVTDATGVTYSNDVYNAPKGVKFVPNINCQLTGATYPSGF